MNTMQLAVKLLPYVGLAISLIAFLVSVLALTRIIEKLRSRVVKLEAQIRQDTDVTATINQLTSRIEELESRAPAVEMSAANAGNLNGTVRSKVLKMHRLGQGIEKIADTLRVPKGEVDLLVKVHQIVMRPYEQTPGKVGNAEAS
jgi:hypothetical protein